MLLFTMSHSSLDLESSEDSIVPDEAVFLVKNLQAEELRLQISPSLGDLGELQECCCRECNVPLHLAQFVCSGHTHGVDRDTERLTNVLACVQSWGRWQPEKPAQSSATGHSLQ